MEPNESQKAIQADAKNSTGRLFRDELATDKRKYEADCAELRKKLDKISEIRMSLAIQNTRLKCKLEPREKQGWMYFVGTLILTVASALTVNFFGNFWYYVILAIAITVIVCSFVFKVKLPKFLKNIFT